MSRDLLSEVVKLEPIVVQFTNFYGHLAEYSDRIWEAFSRNDANGVLSSMDLFTIMIPERAWKNKFNNGLQELLDFCIFESELQKDLATGKRKLTSLEDL
jgi:hypothetical protein